MKRILLTALLLVISSSAMSSRLPAEHEANRLMLAIESSVDQKAWIKAQEQLDSLKTLDVDLPASFFYLNGLVLAETGQTKQAQVSLEQYVVKADKEGEYYVAALNLLTALEEMMPESTAPKATKSTIKPTLESTGDGYVKSLQALYLTDDPVKALVLQINSLLAVHSYTGSRVKKASTENGIVYSLSVSGRDLVLQEKHYEGGQPELRVNKLGVLGLDPFPQSACSSTELMCWIYHPGNGADRWIIIDRDEMVLGELVEAFSKLIRLMQK